MGETYLKVPMYYVSTHHFSLVLKLLVKVPLHFVNLQGEGTTLNVSLAAKQKYNT